MPKSFNANRINVYLTNECLKDLDFLARSMGTTYTRPSRSRLIRILVDAETKRVMKQGSRKGSHIQ